MTKRESNSEFFQNIEKLIQGLDATGKREAANELRDGLSCLNGFTDGWALFMESIDKVISREKDLLPKATLEELESLLETVREMVTRK